jgi:ribosomal protein L24
MMSWIRSLREPRAGDGVKVTDGPYAGQSGVVLSTTEDGRFAVFIDECCQPILDAHQLKRARSRRNVSAAVREARVKDLEGEMRRSEITSRDTGGKGF